MKCKIADFNIEITSDKETKFRKLDKYATDFKKADIVIEHSENDTATEKEKVEISVSQHWAYKYYAIHRKLAEQLPLKDAFVLHAATFDVDGTGVAFAAHSGTGKSTHMLLWQELLGDRMTVVNGDKPIVRFFEDEPNTPYAYGTPWNGKESLGCNMRTQLKHICFIERSETNFVEKMEKFDAVERILKQIYVPHNDFSMAKTLELVNRLANNCGFWIIHCNMEPDAAKVAYNTIFNA